MPCDTPKQGVSPAERRSQIAAALKALEEQLTSGAVTVTIGPGGALAFRSWTRDRREVSDVCAARALLKANSWALRKAIAGAEARGGVKFAASALAAGTHSHDGGETWHPGH